MIDTWHSGIWRGTYTAEHEPKDPPKEVCELLSDFWGATSLHGAVFKKPRGFIFWHCEDCRSPCSPTGMRSHVLPAHGKTQMEVVCFNVRVMRKVEAMS